MSSSPSSKLNPRQIEAMMADSDSFVETLVSWGLIPKIGEYRCSRCNGPLKLTKDATRPDGWRWWCDAKIVRNKKKTKVCGNRVEFRHGTFFSRSHLPLWKILAFASLWAENAGLRLIGWLTEMSATTCVEWASFCREVVFQAFFQFPEKLGGDNVTVEIDEFKFGKGLWVFGGYERGSGRVFMVTVEDRSAETLLPIIRDWIKPGTTIISDYWRAYDCLTNEGYTHLKVDRSLTFKDPDDTTDGGTAHTNAIKSTWRAVKASFSGAHHSKASVPGNLARYMFRKRCADLGLEPTLEFFRLAGQVYNPCRLCETPEQPTISLSDLEKDGVDDDA